MTRDRIHRCQCWDWCKHDVLAWREKHRAPAIDNHRRNPAEQYNLTHEDMYEDWYEDAMGSYDHSAEYYLDWEYDNWWREYTKDWPDYEI